MASDLRARLRQRGPGHYDVLCGKPSCRGWLGRAFAAGAPVPVPKFPEFDGTPASSAEWWPPGGFKPDPRTGTWGLIPRAARRYRQQNKRLGEGEKPEDRSGTEPASYGRQPPAPDPYFLPRSGNLYPRLSDPLAHLARQGRDYSSPHRDPEPDPEWGFPFRARCPECGWPNLLEAPPFDTP